MKEYSACTMELFELFVRFAGRQRRMMYSDTVNTGELLLLATLAYADRQGAGVSMSDIAAMRCISRPAVTQAVEKLVSRGLAEKLNGSDRRTVPVRITQEGRHAVDSAREEILSRLDKIVEDVGEEEIRAYIRIAYKISRASESEPESLTVDIVKGKEYAET